MKKEHKFFLIQIIIATVLFFIFSNVIRSLFYNSSKIESYLSINDGVKEMAKSTSTLLDSLIAKNDVTFDPTSGKELNKVFANLKQTEKEKFLMIGSSQLRVVKGVNDLEASVKTVSNSVERKLRNKIETYNLSLGGMTIPEKLIVSKKASEILNPENLLIAVTPWDCRADKIRSGVADINNKIFSKKEAVFEKRSVSKENNTLFFPLSVNKKISNSLEKLVDNHFSIYAERTGVKEWLSDQVSFRLTFEKELEEKDKIEIDAKTDYWVAFSQDIDNATAWDKEEFKTGSRSLKIVNSKKNSAKWEGDIIYLNKPTNTFVFEGWCKTTGVSEETELLAIDHFVTFTDNTTRWYYKNLQFDKGTHHWQQVKTKIIFDKPVKSIKPHLLFYGGIGTVWFDDIFIYPILNERRLDNIVHNSSAEILSKERPSKEKLNVSYSYNAKQWKLIEENMFLVINHLSKSTAQSKYLLLTPFWHTEKKSAYPQKDQYARLVNEVKMYCEQNNVKCIDASFILNKDNFGIYTNGDRKDKIDVLHFNEQAHQKLAKYIIKNLN